MREFFGFLLAGFGALGGWLISLVAHHLAERVENPNIVHFVQGPWGIEKCYPQIVYHYTPGSIALTIIIGFFILTGLGLAWWFLRQIQGHWNDSPRMILKPIDQHNEETK